MRYNGNGFANGSMGSHPQPGSGWGFGALMRDLIAAWRLIWDPAVPGLLKLAIPFLALLYFIWPLDLMPGPIDDLGILLLAARMFVRMAPQERVYKAYPGSESASSGANFRNDFYTNGRKPDDDQDVIDTTWQVVDDDK